MPSILFTLFLSLACTGETDTPNNNTVPDTENIDKIEKIDKTAQNNTADNKTETKPAMKPSGAGTSTPTGDLPDLTKGLSTKGCDNGPGVHGAASYFVGELKIASDGSVSGEEKWLLYANKKWKEKDGKDCQVRWGLSGSKSGKGACGMCDFGVSLTNAMDKTSSTCPEDLAKNETGQQIGYDIRLHDDGRADIYFSRSGKKVGEGYHKNGTIRYVTSHSCRWF